MSAEKPKPVETKEMRTEAVVEKQLRSAVMPHPPSTECTL